MSLRKDKTRVGAVRYLNTKPLVWRLAERSPEIDLSFDLPSRLADRFARGDLDVALIPAVEALQHTQYVILSDACIACRGPVWSVKLFSRVPIGKIRTLALDEGSRTSVALVQILLAERAGVRPQLRPLGIGQSTADTDADAVLLIGDRAIHSPPEPFAEVWDLGDEWCRWSELPFVFAMWTARSGLPAAGEVSAALAQARDEGLANLEEIARDEAAAVGLTTRECLHYLRDNLHFTLGPRERDGLRLFHQHAARLGLVPHGGGVGLQTCPS
jgi:chorismate dehydratase